MNRETGSSDKHNSRPQPPRNPTHGAKNQRSQQTSSNAADAEGADTESVDAEGVEGEGVEGEGSYTATHRYNEGLREHIQKHDIEREAEAAREALEGDERQELEQAEQRGKLGGAQPAQRQERGAASEHSAERLPQPAPSRH